MTTTQGKLSFNEAKRLYVHRFTMEHVPNWARSPALDGTYYAPQFRSDIEWYNNTEFPTRGKYCRTTGQTWPLGKWLDKPYSQK